MELDKLKAADICKIIEKCAQNGVSELTIGSDFKVSFAYTAHLDERGAPASKQAQVKGIFPHNPTQAEEVEDVAQVQTRSEIIQDEIDNLLITDPFEYERLLGLKELEDAPEETQRPDTDDYRRGNSG